MKPRKSLFLIMLVFLMGMLVTACYDQVVTEVVETEGVEMEGDVIDVVETEEFETEGEEPPAPDPSGDPAGGDPEEGSSDVLVPGNFIFCDTGAPASGEIWDPTEFSVEVTDTSFVYTANHQELPGDGIYYTGVDFQDPTGLQTSAIAGFALGGGTTFGVSTAFQREKIIDISAARPGENGEILPWTTAATAEFGDGFVTIELPLGEIPGGITMWRGTLSDGEICELSGIFEIFNGFNPLPEFSPDENEAICFKDLCFSLREEVFWEPTGNNTGNVTIGANEFILQVYTSAGGADDVVKVFEDTGWKPVESREYESFLGRIRGFDLESSDQVFGSLNVSEPTSGDNAKTAVVAATGQSPLSEADQEALNSFLNQVMDSVRPGL